MSDKPGIWAESAKVALFDSKNVQKYEILPQSRGKLTYFLAEYTSKEPLIRRHFDEDGELIHETGPEKFDGKFGPGVIITV